MRLWAWVVVWCGVVWYGWRVRARGKSGRRVRRARGAHKDGEGKRQQAQAQRSQADRRTGEPRQVAEAGDPMAMTNGGRGGESWRRGGCAMMSSGMGALSDEA